MCSNIYKWNKINYYKFKIIFYKINSFYNITGIEYVNSYDKYSRKPAYLDSTSVLENNMNGWKLMKDNNTINKFKNVLINDNVNEKLTEVFNSICG